MWSEKPTRSTQVPALPPISFASPSRQNQSLTHASKPRYKEAPHGSTSFVNDEPRGALMEYDRLQELERRVNSMEQANRALLEELMVVHSELKQNQSSQDDLVQEVNYLRNKLESRNTFLENELGQKIAKNEADIICNKDSADSLLHSTREMKQELHKVMTSVGELNAELTKCKSTTHQMESDGAKQDVWLKESFAHLRDQISWLSQRMNSALNSLVSDFEHLEKHVTTEHAQLVSRLASDLKTTGANVSEHSEKMRGVFENRMNSLEKLVYEERDSHMKSNSELHGMLSRQQEELNDRLKLMNKAVEECQKKFDQQISAVSSSLSVVATRCNEDQGELSTVLNAEIKMRQREVEKVYSHSQRTQEMCRSSVGALREGLLSLEERVSVGKNETHSYQNNIVIELQEVSKRLQSDFTARVTALHEHIKAIETHRVNTAIEEGTDSGGSPQRRGLSEKVPETISQLNVQYEHLQRMLNGEIEALQKQIGQHSNQLSGLSSALQNLQLRMVGMIQQETSQRFQSILDVKKEMADLQGRLPLTAPTTTHPLLHSQRRQLFPNHTSPSNTTTSPDKRQIRDNNQNAGTTTTGGSIPRPAGVTTKAYSPFPNAEVAESYISDDSESQEESGPEDNEGGVYREQGGGHIHVHNRMRRGARDQFETSPEPHSLQSSITENVMVRPRNTLRQQHARSRPSRSQRHRNRQNVVHPLVQVRYYDDHETQGTFTSAPPTPVSQQKVLVMGSDSNDVEVRPHTADGEVTPQYSNAVTPFNDQIAGSYSDIGDIESHSRTQELQAQSIEGEAELNADRIASPVGQHSDEEQLSDEFDSEGERVTDQELALCNKEDESHEVEVVDPNDPHDKVLDEERQYKYVSNSSEANVGETIENETNTFPQGDQGDERSDGELNPNPTQLHSDSDEQMSPTLSGNEQENRTPVNNELGEGGDEMIFQMS